jgi:hypothetical protein
MFRRFRSEVDERDSQPGKENDADSRLTARHNVLRLRATTLSLTTRAAWIAHGALDCAPQRSTGSINSQWTFG